MNVQYARQAADIVNEVRAIKNSQVGVFSKKIYPRAYPNKIDRAYSPINKP